MVSVTHAEVTGNSTTSETEKPTGETNSSLVEKEETNTQTAAPDQSQMIDGGMYLQHKPDSTELNSLCKFNFIFYFIYKIKYDDTNSDEAYLNYEF